MLWLLLVSGPVASEPQLGKYLCITDYSAGIILQPDGSLVAGRITAAPEKQKFFVTIRAEPGRDFETRRERCFTKQQGEALKYDPSPVRGQEFVDRLLEQAKTGLEKEEADPNYKSPQAFGPDQFIAYCLSNFIADVADHQFLRSLDGKTFSDYSFVDVVFQLLDPTRTFHLYERNVSPIKPPPVDFNDVVYRGRCEFIQAGP
jgi:hypothetical protein